MTKSTKSSKSGRPTRTVEAYIAALPPDAAFILERLRQRFHDVAPDVQESVKYDMPLFEYAGTYLYVGAWKKHIGLYPVYPAPPDLEARLAPYRSGKDTVQFKYSAPIPYDLITEIVRDRIRPT